MSNTLLPVPKPISWPPKAINNEFGIATLSLGNWRKHKLEPRLEAAAKAGYKWIDLFDECWGAYLREYDIEGDIWEATPDNLRIARKLGDLIKSLGMKIACTQPLRIVEGIKDAEERREAFKLVSKRFPFMRAFDTDLVFMCANVHNNSTVTADLKVVGRDLAELGDMAADFAKSDGGPMLKIGYEGLSWGRRNTWSSSWEVVRAADRPNVGLIVDSFNILAVEWADPYNMALHGRVYPSVEEALKVLCLSLASFATTVPGDKIYFFQVGDAELVDPREFKAPTDPDIPALLPWSRGHRLFPFENSKGAYMPVEFVAAVVLATGYQGPISLEVFNESLNQGGDQIAAEHAQRGVVGLQKLAEVIGTLPEFWNPSKPVSIDELVRVYRSHRSEKSEA
ncbi:hypothetical protein Dsin_033185 [Dipteronia sinensis]|uniref:Xylose isomerase-like TIM barrel domain-containing protein n=1 Tax=Dipteronia sinensis TaxID=43782 RepID=A0AAD9ZFN4_9ROSI|nr:hypothetical protein Dsin_033185 [Dipteronia sinensis]